MSGDVTIKVEGLREIEKALVEEFDKAFAVATMAQALRYSMKDVLVSVKARVPRRTGALYDAIDLTPVARATAKRASLADTLSEVGIRIKKVKAGRVGTGDGGKLNPRSYWHLVEFGTSHSSAKSYLRAGWDEQEGGLAEKSAKFMRLHIERARKRIAAKTRRSRG